MITSNTGMPIFVGCKVKVQSVEYVEKFFLYDGIPFGYPENMEEDICGKVYKVTGISTIEARVLRLELDNASRVKGKHGDWAVGNHMVEPVVDKEYIKYIEENPEYFVVCVNSLQL